MFEFDEYIHLAAHAARIRDHHACMTYLKQALQLQPQSATAISMLAMQHAALGLYRRALQGLATALAIEPRMTTSRIQLGLLLLDGGHPKEAKEQFSRLASADNPTSRMMSEGFAALADGQSTVAREKLANALSQLPASADGALRTLLTQLLTHLSTSTASQGASSATRSTDEREISLGAYRQVSQ